MKVVNKRQLEQVAGSGEQVVGACSPPLSFKDPRAQILSEAGFDPIAISKLTHWLRKISQSEPLTLMVLEALFWRKHREVRERVEALFVEMEKAGISSLQVLKQPTSSEPKVVLSQNKILKRSRNVSRKELIGIVRHVIAGFRDRPDMAMFAIVIFNNLKIGWSISAHNAMMENLRRKLGTIKEKDFE